MGRGRRRTGGEAIGVCVLALFAAACSGKSSSEGDDESTTGGTASGGGSGKGGTSSGGTGGVARPPKLGLYVLIRNPDASVPETAGRTCPASTGVEWDIGGHVTQGGQVVEVDSPTPTDSGTTLENGELDTQIACTVRADGGFEIDGQGLDPQITPPNGLISFVLSGTVLRSGPFDLSVYTPITFNASSNVGFPACTMTVHVQSPGALWADFDCPALTSPTEPARACRATGTLVVEYCETE